MPVDLDFRLGIVDGRRAFAEAVAAANPRHARRILGKRTVDRAVLTAPIVLAGSERKAGRPRAARPMEPLRSKPAAPTLGELVTVVAKTAGIPAAAILGADRQSYLNDARYAVVNLAEEFAPLVSERRVGAAINRCESVCRYYRERHRDRLELYPEYLALYEDCRAVLCKGAAT